MDANARKSQIFGLSTQVLLLALVMGVALALRLAYLMLPGQLHETPTGDAAYFELIARNLLDGNGYIENSARAYRPPGFPWFLAQLYRLTGISHEAARVALAILGAAQCMLLTLWAMKLSSTRVAVVAGLLCALDPQLIRFPQTLQSEILYLALLNLALFVLFVALRKNRLRLHVAAGALFGLTALTREVAVFVPLVVGLWYMTCRETLPPRRAAAWTALAFGMALIILPWSYRNFQIFHAVVPISTNGGINFYFGNHPGASGDFEWVLAPNVSWENGLGELEAHRQGLKAGLEFVSQYPAEAASLWARKFWILWRPPYYGFSNLGMVETGMRIVWLGSYLLVVVFGLYGLWLTRRSWQVTFLPLALILYPTVLHIVSVASTRYRLPMVAFLCYFAAIGIEYALLRRIKSEPLPLVDHNAFWNLPAERPHQS